MSFSYEFSCFSPKKQLTGENNEFQKTMVEYESTIKELTILVEQMRIKERSQSLVEEELTILAATLGRLQLEKNQLEKEHVMKKSDLEKLERDLLSIQVFDHHYLNNLSL